MAIPLPVRALHLIALSVVALAQPMFDLLARHGEFFAVRESQPVDILVLVLVLTLVLPLPLVALSALAGWFGQRTGLVVHCALVGLLAALMLVPPLVRHDFFGAPVMVVTCLLAGVVVAVLYGRFVPLRLLLNYICVGFLCLPLLFIFDPAIRKSVFPGEVGESVGAAIASDTPLVLLVLDEFPTSSILGLDGEIDETMFPHFAALARESVWFRNATAVATETHLAIPAILTGRNPEPGRHPTRHDHPRNLLALAEGAYRIDATEPYTSLQPPEPSEHPSARLRLTSLFQDLGVVYQHLFLPPAWSGHLPPVSQDWGNFAATGESLQERREKRPGGRDRKNRLLQARAREFLNFVERIDSSPRSLWFMHSMLPHAPHNVYPSGRYYSVEPSQPGGEGLSIWSGDKWAVSQAYQRHLLQVSLVDNLVGRLMERLKQIGLWDRAIIVVTADHGISFRAGDSRRAITDTNFADILAVPLFVRAPGLEVGRIDDRLVRSTDILPTVAELLEFRLEWPVDGVSMLDSSVETRTVTYSVDGVEGPVFTRKAIERVRKEAVAAKFALFDGQQPGDWYRLGPFGHLVGQPVESFATTRSGGFSGRIHKPDRYSDVSLRDRLLPGQVVGWIEPGPDDQLPWIALAVNGTVRSVTRPYTRYRDQPEVLWSSIIPESSIRGGGNDVEVFTLDVSPDGEVRLRYVEVSGASTDYRGVTLGATRVWGIRESGFHEAGPARHKPHRWTNGAAVLAVPTDPDDPPRELEVTLLGWTPEEILDLRIVVNGVELYAGPAPGNWTRAFALDEVDPASELEIEILSETWGPKNDRGVLVQGVWLR